MNKDHKAKRWIGCFKLRSTAWN